VSAEGENCAVADMMTARVQCRATTRATTIAPTRRGPGRPYVGATDALWFDGDRVHDVWYLYRRFMTRQSYTDTSLGWRPRTVGTRRSREVSHIYSDTRDVYTYRYTVYEGYTPPPPGDARERVVRSVVTLKSVRIVARHTDAVR